jgi:hypothetical protein
LIALGRFHEEPLAMSGLCDMLEMVKDFSFFGPKEFRDFTQIETFSL